MVEAVHSWLQPDSPVYLERQEIQLFSDVFFKENLCNFLSPRLKQRLYVESMILRFLL